MSHTSARKKQASLESFFKPAQPAPSQPPVRPTRKAPPANFPYPALSGTKADPQEPTPVTSTAGRLAISSSQRGCTLSPSPRSDRRPDEAPRSPPMPALPPSAPGRVVKSSDDEDEDSDSSLEDLTIILQSRPQTSFSAFTPSAPSTPSTLRSKNMYNFHTSPMPVHSKHKFDLKSLASHAEIDRKMEASSKRVKAMQDASEEKGNVAPRTGDIGEDLKHSNLLQAVVASQEGVHKVARAVKRTEATLSEQRWYFFDTQETPSKPPRKPFPTKSIPENWQSDLGDPQMRHQTFVTGFAEDMVSFGKALPDEIFLWMLDEMCVESSEPLRTSYCNVLKHSSEQVRRLIVPNVIRKMFEDVSANSSSTDTAEKIRPVQALTEPYAKRDWAKLRTLIKFLGQIAKSLDAPTYVVSLLLRMCIDMIVMENVDIFDLLQESIKQLCKYISSARWETCSQKICESLFNSVSQPSLRLQVVESTPSTSLRTHDLKRRLAMSFYFNDLSYSSKHSHIILDLDKFIDRLFDVDFNTNAKTDYRELAALISLLNIAVDDGRTLDLNLEDAEAANRFDKNIDELSSTIKEIMNNIKNPGAAFISRIEAKEVIEMVSQRISDTLRIKSKAELTIFHPEREENREDNNMEGERKGMAFFLGKGTENGKNKQLSS